MEQEESIELKNTKWEITVIMAYRQALEVSGRSADYYENDRLKLLRRRLDALTGVEDSCEGPKAA